MQCMEINATGGGGGWGGGGTVGFDFTFLNMIK